MTIFKLFIYIHMIHISVLGPGPEVFVVLSAPPDEDGNKLNSQKWVLMTLTVSQGMKNLRLCWNAEVY
jgi:hypothetical protein